MDFCPPVTQISTPLPSPGRKVEKINKIDHLDPPPRSKSRKVEKQKIENFDPPPGLKVEKS